MRPYLLAININYEFPGVFIITFALNFPSKLEVRGPQSQPGSRIPAIVMEVAILSIPGVPKSGTLNFRYFDIRKYNIF